ncbi:MAG TPA: hypothetical protein DIU07_00600, partial [Rhodobacteraceae bacterium]|nr:hypothetical protein [Paracoccaceae bacterium]
MPPGAENPVGHAWHVTPPARANRARGAPPARCPILPRARPRAKPRPRPGEQGLADLFDTIGLDDTDLRRADPRIAAAVRAALGPAKTVINVGAGAGAYEPGGLAVTAVEPSAERVRQRPATRPAAVVRGVAEALPFRDNTFDAAMAVLTVHHWHDQARGLAELRRVARGKVVILTIDPAFRDFWLYDYVPGLVDLDAA